MALSSYAKKQNVYDKKIKNLFKLTKDGFELDLTFFDFYTFDKRKNFFNEKFEALIGKPRLKNDRILKKHYLIAGLCKEHLKK